MEIFGKGKKTLKVWGDELSEVHELLSLSVPRKAELEEIILYGTTGSNPKTNLEILTRINEEARNPNEVAYAMYVWGTNKGIVVKPEIVDSEIDIDNPLED